MTAVDLQNARDERDTVTVRVELCARPETETRFDDRAFHIALGSSAILVDREPAEAVLRVPRRVPHAQIAHPFLALPGCAFAYWRGADPLHGGAFAAGGGAVVVLGAKNAGKTTTLAGLATIGAPVLADDLSVVERGHVLAGPRALDLRAGAARSVGLWDHTRWVRGRRRLRLPAVPGSLPLRAVVVLGWGPALSLHPMPIDERFPELRRLRFFSGFGPAAAPVGMDLLAAPWWRLERPKDIAALPAVAARLREAFG